MPAHLWQALSIFHRSKELVKAGGTRFGTNTLVSQRLMELKSALQQTVVDPEYVAQNYKDLPDHVEVSNCGTSTRENKGGTAKALVLDDTQFWPAVSAHVHVTEPIFKLLRRHDSSAPSIGKIYHSFFMVGEHLKATTVPYKEALIEAFDERWAYGHVDMIAAAYALDRGVHFPRPPGQPGGDGWAAEHCREAGHPVCDTRLAEARRPIHQRLEGACQAH